jgi:hypothetical protein
MKQLIIIAIGVMILLIVKTQIEVKTEPKKNKDEK